VDEIERFSRIDDRILKYMTVLLDKNPDIEKIKEELAGIEAEKKKIEQGEPSDSDKPETGETDELPEAVQQPSEPPESATVKEDNTQTESKEED